MKINFIKIVKNWFLKNYDINRKHELIVTDSHDNKYSLVDLCASLAKEVVELEKRIIVLEEKYECALVDIVRLEGENATLPSSVIDEPTECKLHVPETTL